MNPVSRSHWLTQPFPIYGGITPPEHKSEIHHIPIQTLALPKTLIFPLETGKHWETAGYHSSSIKKRIGAYVQQGEALIQDMHLQKAALIASRSGVISDIKPFPSTHPSGQAIDSIIIETDGQQNIFQRTPLPVEKISSQTLLQRFAECGIVGLGGAGFPMHQKLNASIHTLIVNIAECEPYICCDDRLVQEDAPLCISAIHTIAQHFHINECIIGIESNKQKAIDCLMHHLEAYHQALQDNQPTIKLCILPTLYPSGSERQLIQLTTGKKLNPGQKPTQQGILIQNIATLVAGYKAITQGEALTDRIVTIAGNACQHPGNYRLPIGTPIQDIVDQLAMDKPYQVHIGGPLMGFTLQDTRSPLLATTNCILIVQSTASSETQQASPCIRCDECSKVCPEELLPQQLYWYTQGGDFQKAKTYGLFDCTECGACSWVCPSHIPLVDYYQIAKSHCRHQDELQLQAQHAKQRYEQRQKRLEKSIEQNNTLSHQQHENTLSETSVKDKKSAIAAALARAKEKNNTP